MTGKGETKKKENGNSKRRNAYENNSVMEGRNKMAFLPGLLVGCFVGNLALRKYMCTYLGTTMYKATADEMHAASLGWALQTCYKYNRSTVLGAKKKEVDTLHCFNIPPVLREPR